MTIIRLMPAALLLAVSPAFVAADDPRDRSMISERPGTFEPGPENLRVADPAVLEQLRVRDRLNPGLPRHMTEEEWRVWELPEPRDIELDEVPDYSFLRPPAEYENNDAILMRWGQNNAELTSMIVPITTGDSRADVMLVVANQTEENQAASALDSAGANMDRVEFVQAPSDSVWIRDYGPRFASGDFGRIIIDHEYDRPRPNDNSVPGSIAGELDVPMYELPLAQGGGNYHSFANGEAFITDTILDFNEGTDEQDVKDYFAAFQGVDLTFLGTLRFPFSGGQYDGTGHLDMWFLPVDDETVIIGEYDPEEADGIPYDVTEEAVDIMQDRGYEVIRTPGWNPGGAGGGTHYTYTNGVIVNDIVITCEFGGQYASEDAEALAAYEQAFPDHDVIAVDCSGIINLSGALHCIVKHMPRSEQYGERPPYYDWNRWDGG